MVLRGLQCNLLVDFLTLAGRLVMSSGVNTKRLSRDRSACLQLKLRSTAQTCQQVVQTACRRSMVLQSPDKPPCPGVLQVLAEAKSLTPNQKKKRRQKLAKLGAKHQAGAAEATSSEAGSLTGNFSLQEADSQASTTAFVGFASGCTSNKAPTTQAAVAAADLMSGASTDLGPASVTTHADVRLSNPKQTHPSVSHPPYTSQPCSKPPPSEAVASSLSDTLRAVQPQVSVSSAQTEVSTAVLANYNGASNATSQAQLGPCQPAALICRRDMSSAALAVQASLTPPCPDPTSASPPETHAQEEQVPAKRQKRVFQHGNYNRYYGYRLGAALEEDPRIQVLERRWFHGKRCLDIGCNEGVVTLAAVHHFAPLTMLGVEIDPDLIKAACRALAKQRTDASSLHQRFMRHDASVQLAERPAAQRKAAAAAVRAYANVWFTCEDFASSEHTPQSLDTVLCLSVTKWVHLNQGDEGLKRLFAKVKDALVPGGWFILEPQPWKSYQQAKRKQDMSAAPFGRLELLQLRPEGFVEYLEQELGFVLSRELHVASSSAGFNRPMYLFQKSFTG